MIILTDIESTFTFYKIDCYFWFMDQHKNKTQVAKTPQLFDFWIINHFSVGKLCFCAISFFCYIGIFACIQCICIFVTSFFLSNRNIFHFHLLLWKNNRKNGTSALVWREFNQYLYSLGQPKSQNSVREEMKIAKIDEKNLPCHESICREARALLDVKIKVHHQMDKKKLLWKTRN